MDGGPYPLSMARLYFGLSVLGGYDLLSTDRRCHKRIDLDMVKIKIDTLLRLDLIVFTILLFLLAGCGRQSGTFLGGKRTSQIGKVSQEDLAQALEDFEDRTAYLLRETSQTLRELDPELGMRRSDVIRNLRFTQAMQTMLDQQDPITAFLETWGLTIRLVDYFKTGYGQKLFGEHQAIVINAFERIERNIQSVGRGILSEKEFDETSQELRGFARRHPVNETFSNLLIYATVARPGEPSRFDDLLSVPLAPFTAMKGVDRTASAIYGVKESVKQTADVIDALPESARWESLMLLADMQDTEVVKSLLTSASTFSQSSARLADIAEDLPKEMREQASILIKEIDDRQANLQQTLDKTKETSAALDHSLSEARATIEAISQIATAVTTTAEQWQLAATATDDLIRSVRQWRDSAPEKPAQQSTTVQDYQETIQDVTKATSELQVLIADVRDLIQSEALTARINEVNGCAEAVIDRSATQAHGLADHITWQLMQLAGVITLLALMFRFVSAHLLRRLKT